MSDVRATIVFAAMIGLLLLVMLASAAAAVFIRWVRKDKSE